MGQFGATNPSAGMASNMTSSPMGAMTSGMVSAEYGLSQAGRDAMSQANAMATDPGWGMSGRGMDFGYGPGLGIGYGVAPAASSTVPAGAFDVGPHAAAYGAMTTGPSFENSFGAFAPAGPAAPAGPSSPAGVSELAAISDQVPGVVAGQQVAQAAPQDFAPQAPAAQQSFDRALAGPIPGDYPQNPADIDRAFSTTPSTPFASMDRAPAEQPSAMSMNQALAVNQSPPPSDLPPAQDYPPFDLTPYASVFSQTPPQGPVPSYYPQNPADIDRALAAAMPAATPVDWGRFDTPNQTPQDMPSWAPGAQIAVGSFPGWETVPSPAFAAPPVGPSPGLEQEMGRTPATEFDWGRAFDTPLQSPAYNVAPQSPFAEMERAPTPQDRITQAFEQFPQQQMPALPQQETPQERAPQEVPQDRPPVEEVPQERPQEVPQDRPAVQEVEQERAPSRETPQERGRDIELAPVQAPPPGPIETPQQAFERAAVSERGRGQIGPPFDLLSPTPMDFQQFTPPAEDIGRRGPDLPPAADKPAADKPASDRPASDRPASDRPASDRPAQDQPPQEAPSRGPPGPQGTIAPGALAAPGGLLGAITGAPAAAAGAPAGLGGATADAVRTLGTIAKQNPQAAQQITQLAQQVAKQLNIPIELAVQVILQALQRQQTIQNAVR
jgi:hypothetical protein